MEILIPIVAVVSLIAAYLAFRRAGAIEQRLSETNNKLNELRSKSMTPRRSCIKKWST